MSTAFDMVMAENEILRRQRDALLALVCHVSVSEFDGISVSAINGKSWFDLRDEIIKPKKIGDET